MPKLSIITICFNDKAGLEKTIESVISQSFTDYEFIIIDGGSTDGSRDVIVRNEKKISYWVSEKDTGIYNAMNKGLKRATGEFCLFLNAGDYLFDAEVLAKIFNSVPTEDILYGDMMIDRNNGKFYGRQPEKITFEFMVLTTIWHPVSFIRKSLLDKLGGYNEALKIVSDFEFFLKAIIIHQSSVRYFPFPISIFNTLGIGSDVKYKKLQEEERQFVLEKYFNKEEIQSARQYNVIKQSHLSKYSDWLKKHPLLLKITSSAYIKLKSLRKK